MISRMLSCWKVEVFPSLGWENLEYLHLKDFSNANVNRTCSNQWHHLNARSFLLTTSMQDHCWSWIMNLPLTLDCWLTIPIFRDNILCHFCSYHVVKKEAQFVLECPLYNSIKYMFQSLLVIVVLRSLKSSFRLDYKVGISLYLSETTALRHS